MPHKGHALFQNSVFEVIVHILYGSPLIKEEIILDFNLLSLDCMTSGNIRI